MVRSKIGKYSQQCNYVNMEPIVLIGGGGHCLSCIDVIRLENKYKIVGIIDVLNKVGTSLSGIKIIGTDWDIPALVSKYKNFLITIGQIKSTEKRRNIYDLLKKNGAILPTVISPKAYVSPSSVIDEGTIIMHNALVNAGAVIGRNCIINTGALIEHEAMVEDFCHISTHAVINGQVKIGKNSFIGSNSVIANNIHLPDGVVVGAGAVILKNTKESGTYIGNPARKYIKP